MLIGEHGERIFRLCRKKMGAISAFRLKLADQSSAEARDQRPCADGGKGGGDLNRLRAPRRRFSIRGRSGEWCGRPKYACFGRSVRPLRCLSCAEGRAPVDGIRNQPFCEDKGEA